MTDTIFCHNCRKLKTECKCGLKPQYIPLDNLKEHMGWAITNHTSKPIYFKKNGRKYFYEKDSQTIITDDDPLFNQNENMIFLWEDEIDWREFHNCDTCENRNLVENFPIEDQALKCESDYIQLNLYAQID